MPEVVSKVFEPIRTVACDLHLRWKMYRQLYGTDSERIDLLNEFAPSLFLIVQDAMIDSVYLAISRLTDPLSTGKGENLVLKRLSTVIDESEPGLVSKLGLDAILEEIKNHCSIFRANRNKRIAHNDIKTADTNQTGEFPLMMASRQQVEEALDAIRRFLNHVEYHYSHSTTLYDAIIPALGDGDRLIFHLRDLKQRRIEDPRRFRT